MTAIQAALRRMTEREQVNQTVQLIPASYEHQPRLPRSRILFTPFEAWLLAMAVSMAEVGALVLVWAARGVVIF